MTTSLKHPPVARVTLEEGQEWLDALIKFWNAENRELWTFRDGYVCKWELVSCLAPPDMP